MVSTPDIVGMFSVDKDKKRDSREGKQREKDEKLREKDEGKKVRPAGLHPQCLAVDQSLD
jgi:hypothetical protein